MKPRFSPFGSARIESSDFEICRVQLTTRLCLVIIAAHERQLPRQLRSAFADVYTSRRPGRGTDHALDDRRQTQANARKRPAVRMRDASDGRRARAVFGALLHARAAFHTFRHRSHLSLSLGARVFEGFESLWLCGDGALHYNPARRLHFPLEEGCARLAMSARPESD